MLISSTSLMLAMEPKSNAQQESAESTKEMLFTKFNLSSSCMPVMASKGDAQQEADEPTQQEGLAPKDSFYEAFSHERNEFLVENLKWRVKDVLDANGCLKPESIDTAQELLREACGNDALTGSLTTLLNAGVNPHVEVKGLLSPKEVAKRYSTFALWILEEYDAKGTFKQETSKQ